MRIYGKTNASKRKTKFCISCIRYQYVCTTKYTYIFGKRKDENSKRERLHWIVCSEEEYNDCCSLIVRTACGQITGKKQHGKSASTRMSMYLSKQLGKIEYQAVKESRCQWQVIGNNKQTHQMNNIM